MKKESNNKSQKGEILITTALGLCAVVALIANSNIKVPSKKILEFNTSGDYFKSNSKDEIEEIKLPTFASKKDILQKVKADSDNRFLEIFNTSVDVAESTSDAVINAPMASDKGTIADNTGGMVSEVEHSTTNTQVQGVDESDIVKTDGDFIYYMSQGTLYIFDTRNNNTKLVKTIEITNGYNYYPQELYIDDNYITVISMENVNRDEITIKSSEEENKIIEAVKDTINEKLKPNYYNHTDVTAMYVYDINSYDLVKTVKTEGNYVSSRKIGDNIYLVTNRYIYSYRINEDNVLPIYLAESGEEEIFNEIPANEIKYISEDSLKQDCSYMLITAVNLADIESKASIETILGAGTEIYCSKDNLYVTKIEYNYKPSNGFFKGLLIDVAVPKTSDDATTLEVENNEAAEERVKTKIHKFKLLDGEVKYVATGEVTGSLLNQYSMDENNGYFRITTTSENGNSLYVLNEKLEAVGELKNLAKGEKIYATRFMGDKCYVVTYKTVDPLFVIDLSNPEKPTVLGELKIPGYSTYLHPLGENYLIGFGEDSVEKSFLNWRGEQQVTAYNVGMKLAIFDITDLNNPKELHSIKIGGRGSYSELLNNPKVLYFDEEKEIFAFPASLAEETKFYQDGMPMYGDTIFEGALVYNLSVEDGISLRGTIEHEKNSNEKYYRENNIERIISIEDKFYTVSPNMLKVTDMESMQEIEKCLMQK